MLKERREEFLKHVSAKLKQKFDNADSFYKKYQQEIYDLSESCLNFYLEENDVESNFTNEKYIGEMNIFFLVAGFLKELNPKYEKMFWNDVKNKRINYNKNIKETNFTCNKIMKAYYFINIEKSNTIEDASKLAHEYVHRLSIINHDGFTLLDDNSAFIEVPAILAELKFTDYLEKNGFSYDVLEEINSKRKQRYFNALGIAILESNYHQILNEYGTIDDAKLDNLKYKGIKHFDSNLLQISEWDVNYKHFLGHVLAFDIYKGDNSNDQLCELIDNLNNPNYVNYLEKIQLNSVFESAKHSKKKSKIKM